MANYNISKIQSLDGNDTYVIKDSSAVASFSASGTTITFTRRDGTTGTFTANGKVTGVKGGSESSYRSGNVNVTAANILGSTAIGSTTTPVYWTGSAFSGITSYGGNAATATQLNSTGTTTQFWRGDNTWADVLQKSYTASSGIEITNGDVIRHINNVTAKSSYPSTATTLSANGGTLKLRDVQYDAQGHITASQDRTITLSQVTYSNASTTTAGLMSAADKIKLDGIATGAATGTVTSIQVTSDGGINVTPGTAVTTSGSYTVSLATISSSTATYGSTTDQTPSFNSTFNVPYINVDTYGRVTGGGVKTVKIPAAPAAPVTKVAGMTGDVTLGTLNICGHTYNGSNGVTINIEDLGLTSSMEFKGVITENLSDGATTNPVHYVGGGTLTAQNGNVVLDSENEEYIFNNGEWTSLGVATSYALQNHIHGNIGNDGILTSSFTSSTINSKTLVVASSGLITNSDIAFDTSTASQQNYNYLGRDGTWKGVATSSNPGLMTSAQVTTLENVSATYLPLAGGTMTGTVTLHGHNGTSGIDYGETLPASPSSGQIFFQIQPTPVYEIPSGGTTGQALVKGSNTDRDVAWSDAGRMIPNTIGTKYYVTGSTLATSNISSAIFSTAVFVSGNVLYGAAWNDYAEYRKDNPEESSLQKPGRCVREVGNGQLTLTTERLQRGCEIISDTFGFAIGQDIENGYNTPVASNGRVLAYIYEGREAAANHIGWPVCSGPNGTVSIMTHLEEVENPSCIIGTISEIPDYEEWGSGKIKVNNRIWIRVR